MKDITFLQDGMKFPWAGMYIANFIGKECNLKTNTNSNVTYKEELKWMRCIHECTFSIQHVYKHRRLTEPIQTSH
jgi:hypothetical protein